MLDYQSRVCKFDPPLFLSFRRDFKPRSNFRMAYVMVGGQMPEYTVIKIVEGTHPFINPIALRKAKLYTILAFLCAIGLTVFLWDIYHLQFFLRDYEG